MPRHEPWWTNKWTRAYLIFGAAAISILLLLLLLELVLV